ncbi:hypothetical protein DESC_290207 [Desulfosarcina cetonica]|nr:hypothetical protein DESC_290207 [Desulfosarcina cetonica]
MAPAVCRIKRRGHDFPMGRMDSRLPIGLEAGNGLLIVVAAEDGAAGHEYIDTGLGDAADRIGVDATVNLDEGVQAARLDHGLELNHLVEDRGDEFLTAEAWIDAHDHDEVQIGKNPLQGFHGGRRVEGHAGAGARFADQLNRAVQMGTGLLMDGDIIGPGSGEIGDIAFRGLDHQMDIDGQLCCPANRFEHQGPHRNVGHKASIHDIHMNPVRTGGLHRADLVPQFGKIRRQNRRRNRFHLNSPSFRWPFLLVVKQLDNARGGIIFWRQKPDLLPRG